MKPLGCVRETKDAQQLFLAPSLNAQNVDNVNVYLQLYNDHDKNHIVFMYPISLNNYSQYMPALSYALAHILSTQCRTARAIAAFSVEWCVKAVAIFVLSIHSALIFEIEVSRAALRYTRPAMTAAETKAFLRKDHDDLQLPHAHNRRDKSAASRITFIRHTS